MQNPTGLSEVRRRDKQPSVMTLKAQAEGLAVRLRAFPGNWSSLSLMRQVLLRSIAGSAPSEALQRCDVGCGPLYHKTDTLRGYFNKGNVRVWRTPRRGRKGGLSA